jgi:hypothetical protein
MPSYSHRDHRIYREVYRLLAIVGAATSLLVLVGLYAPWANVGILAILGLAVLGGAALLRSGSLVEGYVGDLHTVGRSDSTASILRVEVESRIEVDRRVFVGARPSPQHRRSPPAAEPVAPLRASDGI